MMESSPSDAGSVGEIHKINSTNVCLMYAIDRATEPGRQTKTRGQRQRDK